MSQLKNVDLHRSVIYFGFLAIFLFFAVTLYDDGFLTSRNLTNIVLQTAPATVMAVGLVFALSAGEIDLSFGSIVAVSALSAAVAMQHGSMIFGVMAGLGAGVLIGAFNGVLVAYLRLPSFLVTLATMGLFAGIARSMTDLRSIPVINETFTGLFGSGRLFGVPSLVIWTIIAVVIGHIVYRSTRFGAHVLAVGDNPRAAQVSGIKVPPHSPDGFDALWHNSRTCWTTLCRPHSGGKIHIGRKRPDDCYCSCYCWWHRPKRWKRLDYRSVSRVAYDGYA